MMAVWAAPANWTRWSLWSAGESLEIVGVLDDVVAEAIFVEGAGGQFRVERHGEDGVVKRQVLLPRLGAESCHG